MVSFRNIRCGKKWIVIPWGEELVYNDTGDTGDNQRFWSSVLLVQFNIPFDRWSSPSIAISLHPFETLDEQFIGSLDVLH